jgi:DNA-binding XRE family transcriptional regulator
MTDDTTLRLRPVGDAADILRRHAPGLPGAALVGENDPAELVVLTPEGLADLIEDAEAAAAFAATRDDEAIPIEIADRLLAGENPVRVWRRHRGMTLAELAERAGTGKGYLSQIETGARAGTAATLKKLAEVLDVDLDDLT